MPTLTLPSATLELNEEGFLVQPELWDETAALAFHPSFGRDADQVTGAIGSQILGTFRVESETFSIGDVSG